ncbi:hypothetical protein B5F40_07765 [Gordonibacter sp. An230]|uniref:zinc ribbon-containing protein n=1 Tax=Gordonibacter sp. An230 TaxID=1965592 RepID=UPI000B3AD66F|nr:hypothetical protein [Gordonibacter sp. An230]OUO90337.1 hypothetical protein B5F40_07765 [Gordonibacter sp. An230]
MIALSRVSESKGAAMQYNTGDKPGEGTYRCEHCGYVVRITSDMESLPACPNCGHHEFEKIEND